MATWVEISDVRLKVCDPAGVIALTSVATEDALPVSPASQTAYRVEADGTYRRLDADLSVWETLPLEISDDRISALIDAHGAARAAPKVVRLITASLGGKLQIARIQSGADSTDFVNLATAMNFYRTLIDGMEEDVAKSDGASTGRYMRMRRPCIGGGI